MAQPQPPAFETITAAAAADRAVPEQPSAAMAQPFRPLPLRRAAPAPPAPEQPLVATTPVDKHIAAIEATRAHMEASWAAFEKSYRQPLRNAAPVTPAPPLHAAADALVALAAPRVAGKKRYTHSAVADRKVHTHIVVRDVPASATFKAYLRRDGMYQALYTNTMEGNTCVDIQKDARCRDCKVPHRLRISYRKVGDKEEIKTDYTCKETQHEIVDTFERDT